MPSGGDTTTTHDGDTTDPVPDTSTTGSTEGLDSSSGDPFDGYPPEVLDELDLPWPPYDYDPPLPAHFNVPAVQAMDNTPPNNPITDAGATLGRVLFYDTALSANDTVSCASCHLQEFGFTDPDVLSEGFEGGLTGRNSMSLVNARFYAPGHFFWDERAATLEEQVLMPIQDEVEMGMTLEQLVEVVESRPYYPPLFEHAFGDSSVDSDRISRALAQFVRSITSYRSPWDVGMAATGDALAPFPNYSALENLGKDVFFGDGRCAQCHLGQQGDPLPPGTSPPNSAIFMLTEAANNGLDAPLVNEDNGVGDHLEDTAFNGVFKSPSLRNVGLTAPFMHDGRFTSLSHAIEHYVSGVRPHQNLDERLQEPDGSAQTLPLTTGEKNALLEFFLTLTDEELAVDPRFSDPFGL